MTKAGINHPTSVGNIPRQTVYLGIARKRNAMTTHGCAGDEGAEALDLPVAWEWVERLMELETPPKALVMTGPGEPLATPDESIGFLYRLHKAYPGLSLGLTSNGLGIPRLAGELADAGVSSVTLLVDAVDAALAEEVYQWVRPSTRTIPLAEGVTRLLADQAEAVAALTKAGIEVYVESRLIPGLNQDHLTDIAKAFAELGAKGIRLVACPTVERGVSDEAMAAAKAAVGELLPLLPDLPAPEVLEPTAFVDESRPYVAVATNDGISVNAHLGQARKLMVYEFAGGGVRFVDARETPEPGDEGRWDTLALILKDCRAVLAAHAGEMPRKTLASHGVKLYEAMGGIEGAVTAVYGGAKGMKSPSCDSGKSC